ncbi:MAG: tetratricopeptide repeat protein, partial [Actinomycetota bacterium]|nr:tetratricopeptide repeat protein [Actinomycetota bacterium]
GDLADFPFARSEVRRLETLQLETADDRLEAELALGHHDRVVGELEGVVESHPLRERSRRQLMLALHRCGRQADALAAFRAGRRLLVDELGLEPGRELQDLHRAVLRDDPDLLVEPAELRTRRHLPAPTTPLIGRRNEIAEVAAMLRGPSVRLVTATGPGGIGKTRLALQTAHELVDAFADGVFFVGLAELRDPHLVVSALAASLGVDEVPDQALLTTVRGHIADRQLLLLLDNFEHVDEAAPLVGQLLAAAAGLKVLATSRSRLRIYGEHDYPVPQLALREEAVPLFAARARAADPTFRVTDRVFETVGHICARLDCLALAIELAAARVTEFTPERMLTVLPRRLDLASSGPRDLAARQQTLRSAIDWSYRLLSADEQRVFAGLAVFVGGCTEEAAGEVCGGTPTRLSSLAAKSLVVQHFPEPGEARFDMLQTIREYGLELLDHELSLVGDAVRDKHTRYFLTLAEAATEGLRGRDQLSWIARLEAERENMRAALTYLSVEPGSARPQAAETALRFAAALGFFWYKTGAVEEGSTWLERALAQAPSAPDVLRAQALHALGFLVSEQGDADQARGHFEASCELFRRAGELAWVARSLNSQGGRARDMGDFAGAERLFVESADLRRRLADDQASLAIVLGNLAMVALDRHDLERARTIGQECLAMAEDSDQWLHAATLQLLADVAVAEGDVTEAEGLLRRALPVLRQLGAYRLVEYLDSCAGLAAALGKAETAARLTGAADAALDAMGARIIPADARMRESRLAAARESLGEDGFETVRRDGRTLTLERALDLVLVEVVPESAG